VYTALLGAIVVYVFTIFGFYFFRPLFQQAGESSPTFECESLIVCLGTFFDNGLRAGGGIGDYLARTQAGSPYWVGVAIYGLLFFFTVPIIILNIVFGVIIDTFSALREEYNDKLTNMKTECFICSLNRDILDRAGGFVRHTKTDHNIWSYLYYVIYLKERDPNECTGVESDVLKKIESEDVTWMPLGQALAVNALSAKQEEAPQTKDVAAELADGLADKVESLQKEITEQKAVLNAVLRILESLPQSRTHGGRAP